MDKKIKFYKVVFGLSIASILISGLIKLIWGVDWFDLEVNKQLSQFFLFKNIIVQHIIMQISLMFNYVLIIAIVNKTKLKDVFMSLWYLLILTYLINYAPRQIIFFLTPAIGIVFNWIYIFKNGKHSIKEIAKGALYITVITIALAVYQIIVLLLRLNRIPSTGEELSFYTQCIILIDIYIFGYFYYKFTNRGC